MHAVRTAQLLVAATLMSATAYANTIVVGSLTLTGNFTLNHNFNFNDPGATPYGTFGTLSAQSVTGIFAPYVIEGDVLSMNGQDLYESSGHTPVVLPSGDVVHGELPPMEWNIGGFEINTLWTNVAGASPRVVIGLIDLTGHGFDPTVYPVFPAMFWQFTAPSESCCFNVTGPIQMNVSVAYSVVPEGGVTAFYLALGIVGLGLLRTLRY